MEKEQNNQPYTEKSEVFSFSFQQDEVTIQFKSVKLELKGSFNTAHSSTTIRQNIIAGVTLKNKNVQIEHGIGQAGLPPKKPKCYLADVNDCLNFAKQYFKKVNEQIQMISEKDSQKFMQKFTVQNTYFMSLMNNPRKNLLSFLICKLHQFQEPIYRAGRCALEYAIFDLWSKMSNQIMFDSIFPANFSEKLKGTFSQHFSFSSLSHESRDRMIQNAKNALQITKYLKIKYNNNVEDLLSLLKIFDRQNLGKGWIIDLNCSWDPKDFHNFYQKVAADIDNQSIFQKLIYLEQPYKMDLTKIDEEEWESIKKSSKIKIIADESFSTVNDLEYVLRFSHGVNIKSQKTGGLINSLKAVVECKKRDVQIMFGCMVCTQIACSQCFQLRPFAQYYDIDGSLLIRKPLIEGGIKREKGGVVTALKKSGLGFDYQDYKYLFQ